MKTRAPSHLFLRIGLVVALVAGFATGVMNFTRVKQKIAGLQTQVASQSAARQLAESELGTTKAALAANNAVLRQTSAALKAATVEQQNARAEAAAQARQAEKLNADLAELNRTLDDTQANLARYRATGLEPEQILAVAAQLKKLNAELTFLNAQNKAKDFKIEQLTRLVPADEEVLLPVGLRATVVASDPKWHFILLDAGQSQGVVEHGEVLISRHGQLIGRARVSQVMPDRCVADLLPGWEFCEIIEGDLALPVLPRS